MPKQFWETVKVLSKHDAHSGHMKHDGTPCHSDLDKANSLNDFFSRCFNTSCQPIATTITSHECSPDLLSTVEEICALLKSLDTSKASGPDGISTHMLTSTADAISTSVTNLFNTSFRCCRPSSSWKISSVVPIPKVPKATSISDYRPISLLSILSKMLERHFCHLIREHLTASHSLSNC